MHACLYLGTALIAAISCSPLDCRSNCVGDCPSVGVSRQHIAQRQPLACNAYEGCTSGRACSTTLTQIFTRVRDEQSSRSFLGYGVDFTRVRVSAGGAHRGSGGPTADHPAGSCRASGPARRRLPWRRPAHPRWPAAVGEYRTRKLTVAAPAKRHRTCNLRHVATTTAAAAATAASEGA